MPGPGGYLPGLKDCSCQVPTRKVLAATWLLLGLCCGCRQSPVLEDRALSRILATPLRELENGYLVHPPDVLALKVTGREDLPRRLALGNDGRVQLSNSLFLELDGQTVPEIARRVADLLDVPIESVEVAVAEHKSQVIFLEGEVAGSARAVPYHGPESLLSFLKRAGGLTAGAAPERVTLRRANAADGKAPESQETNLNRLIERPSEANDLRLHAFDMVVVEPSRKSIFLDCLPPWLSGVNRRGPGPPPDPSTVAEPSSSRTVDTAEPGP